MGAARKDPSWRRSTRLVWFFDITISDGNTVAIGSINNDSGNGENYDAGHVRIYEYNHKDSDWIILGEPILGEGEKDRSGISVSLTMGKRWRLALYMVVVDLVRCASLNTTKRTQTGTKLDLGFLVKRFGATEAGSWSTRDCRRVDYLGSTLVKFFLFQEMQG
eukprot:scaffold5623_cov43-Cylindrotheca_fusiformis.AAC.1